MGARGIDIYSTTFKAKHAIDTLAEVSIYGISWLSFALIRNF